VLYGFAGGDRFDKGTAVRVSDCSQTAVNGRVDLGESECSNSSNKTGKQSVPIRGATFNPGQETVRSGMRLFVGILWPPIGCSFGGLGEIRCR
jgi:hypothetical protein